jgi:calcineurin-like phosphoesterase family protein
MNLWFTSDNHIGHANIIRYSKRPFTDVEEMNRTLRDNWNSVVQQYDIVWMLGDVAFMKYEELVRYMNSLNGIKHLILGNHDKVIENNIQRLISDKVFASIQYYKELTVDRQKLVLLHYGMRVWNKSHHGSWQLHGHSHGSLPPMGKSVDVGVDAPFVLGYAPYRPISFEEIKRYMDKQEISKVDHHGDMAE